MDVLNSAKLYASLGWHVLPVSGKVPSGGEGWQHKTTNDPEQVERIITGDGVGVQLGPKSGIVDVECDSAEASDELLALINDTQTACFASKRGVHYLFRWHDNWPAPTKAVFKIGAIEFRTGNSKAAQSVFPPTGDRFWLNHPSETPIAEFPVMERIHELYGKAKPEPILNITGIQPDWIGTDDALNVPRWLAKHGREILGTVQSEGVTRWFIECPNKSSHTTPDNGKDCCITQEANGKLGGHCFHQSCGMADWDALRTEIGELEYSDFHEPESYSEINIDGILNQLWASKEQEEADFEFDTDEDFCVAMIPTSGVIRQIYEYYRQCSYRESHVMGLAVALSLAQTLFGRRVQSHTGLRTNDYHLVLATTGSGKESCETTITRLLAKADASGGLMLPPDVQSGNGLLHSLAINPCSIWVCDEFGKILQAVLDKKGNQHIKNIGLHLLKLYGKSGGLYGGAAHSDGVRNRIFDPHLVVLGLSTGSTVFNAITSENVSDGLLGRIAFWPVQERPEPKVDLEIIEPSDELVEIAKAWIAFAPGGNLGSEFPKVKTIRMTPDAKQRWQEHALNIHNRMQSESESRASIWTRVAARAMKLALTHRVARLDCIPGELQWDFVQIEMQDINWGIKLANWLAKISCGLVQENTVDKSIARAKDILTKALETKKEVYKRDILRTFRGVSAGDLEAAAVELGLNTIQDRTKGRPKVKFIRAAITPT